MENGITGKCYNWKIVKQISAQVSILKIQGRQKFDLRRIERD
jgi:hypothetical protein